MSKREWRVGDTLWFVPRNGRGEGTWRVIKVGRKWLTVLPNRVMHDDEHHHLRERVDKETLWVDAGGNTSPGRCYESQEAYRESEALDERWRALKRHHFGGFNRPAWATAELLDTIERAITGGGK